jgi:hypothetical protein
MSKKAKVPAFFLNFSGAHFLPNVPKMSVSSIFGLQMPKKSRQSLREISGASATDHLRLSFENSLAAQKFCERVGPDPKSLGNWTSPPFSRFLSSLRPRLSFLADALSDVLDGSHHKLPRLSFRESKPVIADLSDQGIRCVVLKESANIFVALKVDRLMVYVHSV